MKLFIKVVGHVCHDIWEHQHILGGAASYGSILAAKLGHQVSMLTSFGSDFAYEDLINEHGIEISNQPTECTTVFDNAERELNGKQFLKSRARNLQVGGHFAEDADIIFLAPIADEINLPKSWSPSSGLTVGLIQGWLRDCSSLGLIQTKNMDSSIIERLDIVFVSQKEYDDINEQDQYLLKLADHLVVTKGADGVSIKYKGTWRDFPSFDSKKVDTTGAGDIFSMAYAISYKLTSDISRSASFGQAAASISIRGLGVEMIPTEEEILRVLEGR